MEFIACSTAFTIQFCVGLPCSPISSPLNLVKCLASCEIARGMNMNHFQKLLSNGSGHQELHILVGPIHPLKRSIHHAIDQ